MSSVVPSPDLPIYQVTPQILNSLKIKPNLVLKAEPGAGKSTIVPLEMLRSGQFGDGKIIMLEPRRMAAKSIAYYLAKCLDEKVGQTVGYRIKNDTKVSANTKLEIITEGILTRLIQDDPELDGISVIIFDEFHERSLHADLSLMLAKEVQQSLRDDLNIVVMSATLDTQLIQSYIEQAEIVECEGRAFPVSTDYLTTDAREISKQVNMAVNRLLNQADGDVLVFLPGIREINHAIEFAQEHNPSNDLVRLPLHGSLPIDQQELVLQPNSNNKRKVIYATNIAETSLTIAGIKGVVDSGLEKVLTFEPNSGMSRLQTQRISKASAQQRKGRAGRLSEGACIRLWSQSQQQQLEPFQQEEILNADLSDLVMELARWGNLDFDNIDWLTPPPTANFDSTVEQLKQLGLLNSQASITPIGSLASKLPVSPRLAKMLLMANDSQQQVACNLAALISERDIIKNADSADLMIRYGMLESQSKTKSFVHNIRQSARNLFKRLQEIDVDLVEPLPLELTNLDQLVPTLLLLAFPERLAKRRSNSSNKYQLANGKGVFLDESDPLCREEWLVVTNCDLRQKEGRIFSAVAFDVDTFKTYFEGELEQKNQNSFDAKTGRFSSVKTLCYQNLVAETLEVSTPDKSYIEQQLQSLLLTKGKDLLTWTNKCESWFKRLVWLGKHNSDYAECTESHLWQQAQTWLLPYANVEKNIAELKQVAVMPLLKAVLDWQQQEEFEKLAPEYFVTPSDKKVLINYDQDQGPTVSVVLQEVFGLIESPKIANTVNLRFELLSPAKRPIQITSDLNHFWQNSYFDVAKDMRAKYPKHRWPERPLLEKAGRSIKPKIR